MTEDVCEWKLKSETGIRRVHSTECGNRVTRFRGNFAEFPALPELCSCCGKPIREVEGGDGD